MTAERAANRNIVSTSPAYTFTVTGDRTLTAVFEQIPVYTIAVSIDPEESGTVTGAGRYQGGENVILVAAPGDGYEFSGWQENGKTVSENAEYTFTAEADRVLTAAFEKEKPIVLPAGYIRLEYIEATAVNQYIDTKLTDFTGLDIKAVMEHTNTNAVVQYPFCSKNADGLFFGFYFHNYTLYGRYNGDYKSLGIKQSPKRKVTYKIIDSSRTYSADENSFVVPNHLSWRKNLNSMYIFALHGATANELHCCFAKLYSFEVTRTSDNSFVRRFIPSKAPSGVTGLYEMIEGKFYGNSGTGAFTPGPTV